MAASPQMLPSSHRVGKRYALVSVFAQHAVTIAADPNPLAPAQYAAHHRRSVPPFTDPGYIPALRALCAEFGVGAVVPLTDLDLEILGHAQNDPTDPYPRSSPTATLRARRLTSTRPIGCCKGSGCPRRRRSSRGSPSTAIR